MVEKISEYANENSAEYGQWKLDDDYSELLHKKKKKIKRLKKKLKKDGKKRSCTNKKRKRAKREIKALKRKINKLKEEKRKKEMILESQLMQNRCRYDMLRMMFLMQMPKGKERLLEEASKCIPSLFVKEVDEDAQDVFF